MTKKYAGVYPPLIQRIQAEEEHRGGKQALKAVKTKLHQLYGAYTQDNAHKKALALLNDMEKGIDVTHKLLSLHASTKERLEHYHEFYDFILEYTGPVESIIDIGCGYNPFSVKLIPTAIKAYHAYDIDVRVADMLNRYFALLEMPPLAKCADLAVDIPNTEADVALMCKLVPVLEAQSQGSGFRLARNLRVGYLLVTYPLKSLGGREKGMGKHYGTAFEKALADGEMGHFVQVAKRQIGNELLYLMRKEIC